MLRELRTAVAFTVVTMVAFGGLYPLAVWAVGTLTFPRQAQGSLVVMPGGTIAGSSLIAQPFASRRYFHPRPSGVDYNAASAGGTNHGPSNLEHWEVVSERLVATMALEGAKANEIPSEMVTASGAGLDPQIPPAAARLQARRVALERSVPVDRVLALIDTYTEKPALGVFGRPRVNVLQLNLALDERLSSSTGDHTSR